MLRFEGKTEFAIDKATVGSLDSHLIPKFAVKDTSCRDHLGGSMLPEENTAKIPNFPKVCQSVFYPLN